MAVGVRNDLTARYVEKLKLRDGYESAKATVIEILHEQDPQARLAVGDKSVEAAHIKHYPKKG